MFFFKTSLLFNVRVNLCICFSILWITVGMKKCETVGENRPPLIYHSPAKYCIPNMLGRWKSEDEVFNLSVKNFNSMYRFSKKFFRIRQRGIVPSPLIICRRTRFSVKVFSGLPSISINFHPIHLSKIIWIAVLVSQISSKWYPNLVLRCNIVTNFNQFV